MRVSSAPQFSQRKKFDQVLERLVGQAASGNISQIDTMKRKSGDCWTFPKGRPSQRVFFYIASDGSIRVCEIASHHDCTYEDLYKQGVFKRDYPEELHQRWHAGAD